MIKLAATFTLITLTFSVNIFAAHNVRTFTEGSYQQLLSKHTDKAYVLIIWSINCAPCIEELTTLREIHRERPDINLVLLAINTITQANAINKMLAKKGLGYVESWVFAETNTQRLRYEIDPTWYGEIPRIYFFDAQHRRLGFSGKMTKLEFFSKIASVN